MHVSVADLAAFARGFRGLVDGDRPTHGRGLGGPVFVRRKLDDPEDASRGGRRNLDRQRARVRLRWASLLSAGVEKVFQKSVTAKFG